MLLSSLPCADGPAHTTESDLAQGVTSAEVEKPRPRASVCRLELEFSGPWFSHMSVSQNTHT